MAVLVLSQFLEPEYALRLLAASADGVGYLWKDRLGEVDQLLEAARRVAADGTASSHNVAGASTGIARVG